MKNKIIVDSCCDAPGDVRKRLNAVLVPLIMRLGQKEYIDDETLDLPQFMRDMRACTCAVGSASPPPTAYQNAFERESSSYAITLSSKLSGSYSSAMLGKALAEENGAGEIHVFDSKSASAGMTLVALKLKELIDQEIERSAIIQRLESFIDNMKTYFVLENYDNLQKNGRLNKIVGKLISVMNIKLLMGSDGNGNIALYAKPRGTENMLNKLMGLIESSGKDTAGERLVISHCNNTKLAQRLHGLVRERFHFSEVLIVPTGGLSSLYADEQGIVMAF